MKHMDRVEALRRRSRIAMALGAVITVMSVHAPVPAGADASSDRLVFHRVTSGASSGDRWGDAGTRDIYTVDVDGSNLAHLGSGFYPVWSPDGDQIVFSDRSADAYDIYVMDADGSNRRQLTSSAEDDTQPSWSPDGDRIVFRRAEPGAGDGCFTFEDDTTEARLWLMNADGSGETSVSTDAKCDHYPSFSPDGGSVVYEEMDHPHVKVLDLRSGDEVGLLDDGQWPVWSADGTITVSIGRCPDPPTCEEGNLDLYKMGPDGSDWTRLTDSDEDEYAASWSMDGETVAFTRNPDWTTGVSGPGGGSFGAPGVGSGVIHVMAADGTEERAVTSPPSGAGDGAPKFRPSGSRGQPGPATDPAAASQADAQAEAPAAEQADGSGVAGASLPDRSEGWTLTDRAPTVDGVGLAEELDDQALTAAGQPNERTPTTGWPAALIAALVAVALVLMGFGGFRLIRR